MKQNSLTINRGLLWLFLFINALSFGQQVNFTDSNLPIFIITTDVDPNTGQPREIPDDPKVGASLKIIYHPDGSRNYMTDQNATEFLNYNGRIKIELRGSSSQSLPKKQYGWTTYDTAGAKQNVSLLGMPKENDWILNGLAYDPSLIRDYLSYNLARNMGQYATRTQFCEVVINGNYRGLYILQEKIKDDSNRVNIEEITEDDTEGVNLTGGYITKADKTTGGDPVAWTMPSYAGTTDFIHELPKPEDVTEAQNNYIHSQFTSLETKAGAHNHDIAAGYPSVIDVPTFVDFMLLNELSSNVDVYQISTYFHKDRGGKLRAGPVWDFNLSFGNDVFGDRSKTNIWQFSNGDNEGAKFWTDLFNDDVYKCYLSKRWNAITAAGQPLNAQSISAFIDATINYISEAAVREDQRWDTVDLQGEITFIKNFVNERIIWMNNNIGSFTACDDVTVPSLVISGINYNPGEDEAFPESDDQEFIEITNTGTTAVNLTGFYLSELGVSYQFPVNSTIAAGQKIYLASNQNVFDNKYDLASFGQFVRNMPNSNQNLVLADAFGNKIDEVHYYDSNPWPNADGNGNYLHLTDNTLDNSLAASWTAADKNTLSGKPFVQASALKVYPNPVNDTLTIQSGSVITNVIIVDIYGKVLQNLTTNSDNVSVAFSGYATGIYFVKVSDGKGVKTQKVIKR